MRSATAVPPGGSPDGTGQWALPSERVEDDGLSLLLVWPKLLGMCGIVGYVGKQQATPGPPSDENSHPHYDASGRIALVHNGVIENYEQIRERLKGHHFQSSTDTEVLAHLIGEHYEKVRARLAAAPTATVAGGLHPLAEAVTNALREVIGAYGIAVVCADHPEVIVGARRGSPLIVGVGEGENFLASDANAIAPHTRQVVYLNDYDVATLTPGNFNVANLGSDTAQCQISQLEFEAEAAERGDFQH